MTEQVPCWLGRKAEDKKGDCGIIGVRRNREPMNEISLVRFFDINGEEASYARLNSQIIVVWASKV
jgi:hypothetical protein